MDFSGFFLIVSELYEVDARARHTVGDARVPEPPRLSPGSLDITNLDPIRFGLLFERFLNPERVSMPDFDIDFCQERRDEVVLYVRDKYGADRVAHIIALGSLQARAAVRDVGRVLQMPLGLVDRIAKLIPNPRENRCRWPTLWRTSRVFRRSSSKSRWPRSFSRSSRRSKGFIAMRRPIPPELLLAIDLLMRLSRSIEIRARRCRSPNSTMRTLRKRGW